MGRGLGGFGWTMSSVPARRWDWSTVVTVAGAAHNACIAVMLGSTVLTIVS